MSHLCIGEVTSRCIDQALLQTRLLPRPLDLLTHLIFGDTKQIIVSSLRPWLLARAQKSLEIFKVEGAHLLE